MPEPADLDAPAGAETRAALHRLGDRFTIMPPGGGE